MQKGAKRGVADMAACGREERGEGEGGRVGQQERRRGCKQGRGQQCQVLVPVPVPVFVASVTDSGSGSALQEALALALAACLWSVARERACSAEGGQWFSACRWASWERCGISS